MNMLEMLAELLYAFANAGAGTASALLTYEPEIPAALVKEEK